MTESIVKYSSEELKRIGHGLVKQTKEGMKKAGKLLIKAGRDAADRDFAARVTARVQELTQQCNALYIARDRTLREIAFYEQRLAAIANGEFIVTWGGDIQYKDKSLQTLNLGEIHG